MGSAPDDFIASRIFSTPDSVRDAGAVSTPRDAEPGDTIDGRYRLRREIARGGMSVVFEAEHLVLRRTVALKLARRRDGHPIFEDRLIREARALSDCAHPGVVTLHDAASCPRHGPYLAMEYLRGRTLEGVLASRRQLEPVSVLQIAGSLCESLSRAHDLGIVHRDIKPANVFITRAAGASEVVKLFDFGLVRFSSEATAPPEEKLTRAGSWVGTPEYMAPEQLAGEPDVDARGDLYALGATMFECLTGEIPFTGSYVQLAVSKTHDAPPRVERFRPDVPKIVCDLVDRAIARHREDRFESAAAFGRAIEEARRALGQARDATQAASPAGAVTDEHRRRYARAPFVTPVRVVRANGPAFDARSEDVSEGGMLFVGQVALTAGERLRLRFASPLDGQLFDAEADVRWVKPSYGRFAVGLEFVAQSAELRAGLKRFIELMVPRASRAAA